jgi:hypothetical protein
MGYASHRKNYAFFALSFDAETPRRERIWKPGNQEMKPHKQGFRGGGGGQGLPVRLGQGTEAAGQRLVALAITESLVNRAA